MKKVNPIIVNDANDYANETSGNPAYPLELLLQVSTVSLKTLDIVGNSSQSEDLSIEDIRHSWFKKICCWFSIATTYCLGGCDKHFNYGMCVYFRVGNRAGW